MKLKLRKIGNSRGVIVPRKVVVSFEKGGVIDFIVREKELYDLIDKKVVKCTSDDLEIHTK